MLLSTLLAFGICQDAGKNAPPPPPPEGNAGERERPPMGKDGARKGPPPRPDDVDDGPPPGKGGARKGPPPPDDEEGGLAPPMGKGRGRKGPPPDGDFGDGPPRGKLGFRKGPPPEGDFGDGPPRGKLGGRKGPPPEEMMDGPEIGARNRRGDESPGSSDRRRPQGDDMIDDPTLRELNQRERDIEARTMTLARTARRVQGADREKAAAELVEAVAKHLALRQERRELEIKRISEQLEKLRTAVKKRNDEKQSFIDRRVKELLNEDDAGF